MQPKNLGWKFAFVGLLIAMGLYSIWAKELRQGIDLKGGHILTFEIQTAGRQREGLKEQAAALKKELKSSTQPARIEQLEKRLAEVNSQLDQLGRVDDEGNLVQRAIDRLKDRIDPNGLYSLEWRVVGRSRFEVRMPLGTEEARRAKQKYLEALHDLRRDNIQRSELRRVVALTDEKARADEIRRISRGDAERAAALKEMGEAHDAMVTARAAWEKAKNAPEPSREAIKNAEEARLDARADYDSAVRAVLGGNVNTERLGQIVELHVSDRERRAIPRTEAEERAKAFEEQLAQLRALRPARAGTIDRVVSAYVAWADKRVGLDDPADLKRMVAQAGVLEFRIAATLPGSSREPKLREDQHEYYLNQLAEQGPLAGRSRNEPLQWFELRGKGEGLATDVVRGKYAGRIYVLLCDQPGLTMLQEARKSTWSLTARPDQDRLMRPAVGFRLDARGARLMGKLTGSHIGKLMAILLDDQAYSAPNIESAIFARGIIEGSFTTRQVGELVRILNAGALEGRVNKDPVSEKTIAPSMGEDNRKAGIRAAIWGLIGVAGFMMLYYLSAGAIADVALLLNLVLLLGAMSFIEAVFTLPGIAGVILTIGMAVDANVLIFERLREEQEKTQSMRMAVRNAYRNAASAILDGNVTTLMTCLILGWVGTEEVRGFAITLGLGVMFSLFTSLIVTRWIFMLLLEMGLIKNRVRMLAFIGTPKINWMAKRRIFWTISAALVAVGIAALCWQGKDILGIEFSSGTQAVFAFKHGAKMIDRDGNEVLPRRGPIQAAIRDKAESLAAEARADEPARRLDEAEALDKLSRTAKVETLLNPDKAVEWIQKFDTSADRQLDASEWAAAKLDKQLFASLDSDRDGRLVRKELADLPERSYQVSTTVAKLELLRKVVSETFGGALDMPGSVKFAVQKTGRVPGLNVELKPADDGLTHISSKLEQQITPELRGKFTDFIGGAMLVIHKVAPAVTEAELAKRIETIRWQPDFADYQYNVTAVIGLEADPEGEGFISLAVLARNPNVDYVGRQEEWKDFAGRERYLLTKALERQESIESREFDPAIAGETGQLAIIAFVLSWLAIIAYLWLRFGSVRWGLAAVVCLIHDTLIAVGLVAVSAYVSESAIGKALLVAPFRIDMAMVAAFLTIIGYSVNDTIVVFDRIRENRGRLTTVDERTINRSINQVLSRTLLTTTTTLIAVVVMYVFGGAGIHAFTYALLIGIIFGTYSSVAIASPLLLGFKHAVVGKVFREPAPVPK